ncbi:ROK family protein [Heyndrickxia sp. NPDC080065]|uniref:ROK family protein n=1 Tax=Heyndrickxia sp. NPDC080065 TaxID=3390568 RepID=UPI003D06CF21
MKYVKVLGIDIGGTSIKGIVIDDNGNILQTAKVDTEATLGREHIIENLKNIIEELLITDPDIKGIGIGTAGRVNTNTGEVVYATENLKDWQGLNLRKRMEHQFNLPVMVDNDANVALIGEHWIGAGKGLRDITMLTLGTGVGGANMLNGNIFRGENWSSGEWGHVVLIPNGCECNCGQSGCIEQYLSGNALVYFAEEATNRTYSSGIMVMEDYKNKRKEIISVVEEYVNRLSIVISNIYNGINPQSIIIGGGVIESKEIWWSLFTSTLMKSGLKIDVRPALLGNMAGSIGAAKLILEAI